MTNTAHNARLQAVLNEGLASGISELSVEDILARAVKKHEQAQAI